MSMGTHHWHVAVDRGEGLDTLITETDNVEMVYTRIGQMVLSDGIECIVVYRDDVEYRRYELRRPS